MIDLLGDFTNPIPNTVISRIVGVQAGADEVRFRDLAQEMIRGFFPFAPPEALGARRDGAPGDGALDARAWWRSAATAPREDLISDLLRAQGEDERVSDDEIVMLVSILIGAGSETTNLGGLVMIRTLLEHPEQLEARARRPLARPEGRERDHALRLRRAGRHARATRCATSRCAARRSARDRC